jgi:hypothetical protein
MACGRFINERWLVPLISNIMKTKQRSGSNILALDSRQM